MAQAVSRLKAEVSGTWHLGFEAADHPVAPHYDFARIKGFGQEAATDNASWRDYFRHHQITPLHLTYEALAEDPTGVAKQAMRFLGLQPDAPLTAANRRMADAVSAEWAQRFRAEAAADGC